MTQLETFTQMIDGLPEHIRNSYSPTTRVVDSELPQETRLTLTTTVSETQFVFDREGTLVDIMQCRVSHPDDFEDDRPVSHDLADIIDKRWSLGEDANG